MQLNNVYLTVLEVQEYKLNNKRTKKPVQVYLNQKEFELLEKVSEYEGLSKSDILRRLIRRLDFNREVFDQGLILDDHVSDSNKPVYIETRHLKPLK
jgi:Ribbon-helix-helix protein, copG family